MKGRFVKIRELVQFLELNDQQQKKICWESSFPLSLPYRLAKKIKKGTLDDPILLQFVPLQEEQVEISGFSEDPLQEKKYFLDDRLIQKYSGRALILCTNACAMHCRYCFRRCYKNKKGNIDTAIEKIAEDVSIEEVILSGGDPLSLSNEVLEDIFNKISEIDHITRVRFHTRYPIGYPERIDDKFLKILDSSNKQIYFVIHVNHPNELDDDVLFSLKKIQRLGIPVLNQAVLLKNVNDSLEVLTELANKLADNGIIFYYLYQLDKVQGSAHFEVFETKGLELMNQLRCKASGFAVPKYACEIAGEKSKTSIYRKTFSKKDNTNFGENI